jgi:hypothetical protein
VLNEHFGDVLFPDLEVQGKCAVVVAVKEFQASSFDRCDDEASLSGGNLPQRCGACLLNFGVGREIFERENVMGRESQDGFGGESTSQLAGAQDSGVKGLSGFVVGDDDDARGVGSANEEREIEGAGGKGQTGHTSTPRAPAQVAAYTLKSLGVLQVCEELADEWKDHASSILFELREACA